MGLMGFLNDAVCVAGSLGNGPHRPLEDLALVRHDGECRDGSHFGSQSPRPAASDVIPPRPESSA